MTLTHSPGNLRTNRVLSNFQEFYSTYSIQPSDGMYVDPQTGSKSEKYFI
ncbi:MULTISPECIES: M13-type metalloendopeptidase [Eisenbergiella]|nr:hypothetical protein [Clostridium sp.]